LYLRIAKQFSPALLSLPQPAELDITFTPLVPPRPVELSATPREALRPGRKRKRAVPRKGKVEMMGQF
jgi:hypothetical protein